MMNRSLKHAAGIVTASIVAGLCTFDPALAHDELTVVTWGGALTKSQMLAYVRPYETTTGNPVDVVDYDGGIEQIREQVNTLNVKWDVVDLLPSDATRACEEGLLEPIDHDTLPDGANGLAAIEDFVDGALQDCAIASVIWSNVLAYDAERFQDPAAAPSQIADLFDVGKFPGKRGLQKTPRVNLEWALMSDGVPADQVYKTLSTADGVDRAFAILEKVKPFAVWWTEGTQPPRFLANEEVVMTSSFNGRIYNANVHQGKKFHIVWAGQIWDLLLWGIPKGTTRLDQANSFVAFATDTERLADQAQYIAYGPARVSSMALIDDEVKSHLPTAEENSGSALQFDALWWAENEEALTARFNRWLEAPVGDPSTLGR